jgi:peptidoglycan/xylan/chitin deacetylase (PgdA/CDA1 family)
MTPKRDSLVVLNYHRLGHPALQPYDEGTFSATADEFTAQVAFLKKRYCIITLDEAVEMATTNRGFRGTAVLLTFDDGYLDNFEIAYPILRSAGVQGTFFLISSLVGSREVPWWDRIAFAVKNTIKPLIALHYPRHVQFDLGTRNCAEVINMLLAQYKALATRPCAARFLAGVEEACDVQLSASDARLFLDWRDAAEMKANGMAIGCHTHTHPVLSQLTVEEQYEELRTVRDTLRARLSVPADVLAYPVGKRATFTWETQQVLQQLGYRAAFSYYGGVNLPGNTSPFDIRRNSVDAGLTLSRLRMQLGLASITGSYWF